MYDPNLSVRAARLEYLLANGLPPDGGVGDRWIRVNVGPIPFIFPNFESRKRALICHDLHHVANDCDTSLLGEGLVAAWELGRGFGVHLIGWFLQLQAVWWGIILGPRETFAMFLKGRASRNMYFETSAEPWLDRSVGELREYMFPRDAGADATAIERARLADRLRFAWYALCGVFVFWLALPFYFAPITIALLIWWVL